MSHGSLFLALGLVLIVKSDAQINLGGIINCELLENQNHVACRAQQPSQKLLKQGINIFTQGKIISEHNQFRSLVAKGQEKRGNPGPQSCATDMNAVYWDPSLAVAAQLWANQCRNTSDLLRTIPPWSYNGQNVFTCSQSLCATDLTDLNACPNNPCGFAGLEWYNQVAYFPRTGLNAYRMSPSTNAYAQLVYSRNTRVGCGSAQCIIGDRIVGVCVCNYGHGIQNNDKVYTRCESDDVCSACNRTNPCDSSGLCVGLDSGCIRDAFPTTGTTPTTTASAITTGLPWWWYITTTTTAPTTTTATTAPVTTTAAPVTTTASYTWPLPTVQTTSPATFSTPNLRTTTSTTTTTTPGSIMPNEVIPPVRK